jgi:transcriptional regulator with XRE-family HTH domain
MSLQSREDLIAKLHEKHYRDAFVSSRVSNTLALQIRAMRQAREWSQAHLAELLGTSQNAVWRLESPQYGKYSITTLKRLASIFDVGLAVWLVPFSKLVDRVINLSTEDILVPSFNDDLGFQESIAISGHIQTTLNTVKNPLLTSSFQRGTVNRLTFIGNNATIALSGTNNDVISKDDWRSFSNQKIFVTGVDSVSLGSILVSSVQTSEVNRERRATYISEPVGTAA